jgi:hypothetical protein
MIVGAATFNDKIVIGRLEEKMGAVHAREKWLLSSCSFSDNFTKPMEILRSNKKTRRVTERKWCEMGETYPNNRYSWDGCDSTYKN